MQSSARPELRKLAINSAVIYVVAFILTTVIHELAHAVMGVAVGGRPTLHNNYVTGDESIKLAASSVVAIKLAGPIVSLMQGALFTPFVLRRRRRDIWQLLLLWMAILGYNNFLGYLFTGAFSSAGDIGAAVRIAGLPTAAIVAISIAGVSAQLWVIWQIRRPFLSFAFAEEQLATAEGRRGVLFHGLIAPWFVGSIVFTLISLPSPALLSLIYPLSSGMPFIMPWRAAGDPRAREGVVPSDGSAAARVSAAAVGVLLVLIVFNQLVLKRGVPFY